MLRRKSINKRTYLNRNNLCYWTVFCLILSYQNFRDLSKLLDRDQTEVDHNSLELRNHSSHPASIDGIEIEQQWRSQDKRDSNRPLHP